MRKFQEEIISSGTELCFISFEENSNLSQISIADLIK